MENITERRSKIVGWTYEADVHCLSCSQKRFKKWLPPTVDREGNTITPVFYWDDASEDACGDCFEILYAPFSRTSEEIERETAERREGWDASP